MSSKIAILMPVYNRPTFVVTAIASALASRYDPVRVIVYDDGSTDNTATVVQGLAKKDDRITLVRGEDNCGPAIARQCLLNIAREQRFTFAAWHDSDDVVTACRIGRQVMALAASNANLCVTAGRMFQGGDPPMHLSHKPPVYHPITTANASAMFRITDSTPDFRPDVHRAGPPAQSTRMSGEDCDWLERVPGQTIVLPETCYWYRHHSDRIGVWVRTPEANADWYRRHSREAS